MDKDVLIIASFTTVPGEKGNSRFNYIAQELSKEEGLKLELITSNFSHEKKEKRYVSKEKLDKLSYKLTMVKEKGYKKNICLKRLYSHYTMAKSLKVYLNSRKKPDLIYCAIPSLSVGKVVSRYCKKNNIKFVIDVQDLWPEAFMMIFNIPIISNGIYFPFKVLANSIYKAADKVVAVSNTYVKRVKQINRNDKEGVTVFLGTDLNYFDNLSKNYKIEKKENEIWISYIGTLGHSYNIKVVIDAISLIKQRKEENIKLIIMGNGPLKEEFEEYAKEKKVEAVFTGRLEYSKMASYLTKSDIAVNPIKKGASSIINKVGDYAAASLPVLNTQESDEYRELVTNYNIGLNSRNEDPRELANNISKLVKNKRLRETMGLNNRKLAEEKFDRRYTYKKIFDLIKSCL